VVDYRVRELGSADDQMMASAEARAPKDTVERHVVRYFFPAELLRFLQESGFTLEHHSSFPDVERPADETTWNALLVARRAAEARLNPEILRSDGMAGRLSRTRHAKPIRTSS